LFLFLLLVLFLGSCWDCSEICVVLFLKESLLLPFDVETDLGSTSVDDNSRGVQEWPLLIPTLILLKTVVVVVVAVIVYVLKYLRAVMA